MRHIEHQYQAAVIQWCKYLEPQYPELKFLFAIPNGLVGRLKPVQRARAKAEGYKAGPPDICIPFPRGKYCGMWIEMKSDKGTLSDAQHAFVNFLRRYYYVVVCNSPQAAMAEIKTYLSFPRIAETLEAR